jgi:hypothetical protein
MTNETSAGKQSWTPAITVFYCVGVAMTLACLALILAGNTDLGWRLEHQGFPLSWVLGSAAILAFLAAEYSPSTTSRPSEAEDQSPLFAPDLEAPEFEG